MTTWRGMDRKTTPIAGADGSSFYQQNTRLHVDKELGRRLGMASTNLPSAGAGIIGIGAAYTPNGPVVVTVTPTTVIGNADPLARWRERYLVRPIGGPVTCTLWGPNSYSGINGDLNSFVLPASSCLGSVTFTSAEAAGGSGGSGAGGSYGYSVVITVDGIIVLSTACLVNNGAVGSIPANALNVQYAVTAGCAGGSIPGLWELEFSSP